jgi:hypothetical protein
MYIKGKDIPVTDPFIKIFRESLLQGRGPRDAGCLPLLEEAVFPFGNTETWGNHGTYYRRAPWRCRWQIHTPCDVKHGALHTINAVPILVAPV